MEPKLIPGVDPIYRLLLVVSRGLRHQAGGNGISNVTRGPVHVGRSFAAKRRQGKCLNTVSTALDLGDQRKLFI